MRIAILTDTLFSHGELYENYAVIIENEKIVNLGPISQMSLENVDNVLEIKGHTLMPGLIDAHIHFGPEVDAHEIGGGTPFARLFENPNIKLIKSVIDAKNLLEMGFTAARDGGGKRAPDIKTAIDTRLIPGPRLKCAGRALTALGGLEDHPYLSTEWVNEISDLARVCSDINDCIKAVREQRKLGAEIIKIFITGLDDVQQFSDEEIRAVVCEAKRVGMEVCGHALGGTSVQAAVRAGCYTVEHGVWLTESDCQAMKDSCTIYDPTPAFTYQFIHHGMEFGAGPRSIESSEAHLADTLRSISMAHQMGVVISTGTDFGLRAFARHGKDNLLAIFLLHEAGLSTTEALVAATVHAAETLLMQDVIGKIMPGYWADIIAVKGNPVDDLNALKNVDFVMKGGEVIVNHLG